MQTCHDCGAPWPEGLTCQDYFYQMLAWEHEEPALGVVHHLVVLCYHLQHPALYSPEGLEYGKHLLVEFVANSVSAQEIRVRSRSEVSSRNRKWKIKGTPGSYGAYNPPILWTMTVANVIDGGMGKYCENVRLWAQSIYSAIKEAGQLRAY